MSVRLDDMRLVAKLAEHGSLTAVARDLGMPKQTLSRRLAELEAALGVALARRTTRRVRLTELGQAYAAQCADIVRRADDANAAVTSDLETPRGTLRISADPTFGEAFLPNLVANYLREHTAVRVEVMLTAKFVDLIDEGIDVAFRVGRLPDSGLIAVRLGDARLCYCASPRYLSRAGVPKTPQQLAEHDCIELTGGDRPSRWPFVGPQGLFSVPVQGRMRTNSLSMARRSALAGLGIANLPTFACADDLREGRLVAVLDTWLADAGSVHIIYPEHRFLAASVRSFVDLATSLFRGGRAWNPVIERRATRRKR